MEKVNKNETVSPSNHPADTSIQENQVAQTNIHFQKRKFLMLSGVVFLILLIGALAGSIYYLNKSQKPMTSENKVDEVGRSTGSYSNLTPSSQLKEAKHSDAKGKVVFVTEGEIWSINSDGTNLKQLTNDENSKFHISASSDGKKIAYGFYPKDEKKRTNQGYYVGYNSGLAIFDIDTKNVKTLIPYGSIQNHYPVWSQDNKYISVWVGNGVGSRLIDVSSGADIFNLKGSENNYVSPIVWIPTTGKVSFVENKNLVSLNIDGSDRQTLATGVDSLRQVHEGPNVPQPPLWSQSGRYVAFYKSGDLHLMDAINKTDVLVEKGSKEEMFNQNYPQAYPIGFNLEETKLYMYDSAKQKDTVVLDIKTGRIQEIADLGQTLIMSPDKQTLFGQVYDPNRKIIIINLSDNSQRECPGTFDYSYYGWAGGTGYVFRFDTWSSDNKGILGYKDYGNQGLNILNIKDCSVFDLVTGKSILSGNAIWLPQ